MTTVYLATLAIRSLPARFWNCLVEWVEKAFGNMATREFWVKLLETIVKQMVNAFAITLGGRLMTYGVSREDPEVKKTATMYTGGQTTAAASAAFNGNSVRPDYANQYANGRSYSAPAPSQTPLERSFPMHGFGGTTR
jgi:hypothetical protein